MTGHDFLTQAIDKIRNINEQSTEEKVQYNNLADELDSLTEEDLVVMEAMITEAFNTSELASKIVSIIQWILSTGVMSKLRKEEVDFESVIAEAAEALAEGRGRPKGSKNKPKVGAAPVAARPVAKKDDDEEEEKDEGPAYRSASLGDTPVKRGRGRPTGAVENAHIQDQLKSAVDLGGKKVTFRDGKSHHVKAEHAQAVLDHLHSMKPADRANAAASAFDSHDSFKNVLQSAMKR